MLKGKRTYIMAISGVLTGLAMISKAIADSDYSNIETGITLVIVSATGFFQRAAVDK